MNVFKLFFSLPATNSPEGSVNTVDHWKSIRMVLVSAVAYLVVSFLELLLAGVTSGQIDLGQFVFLKEALSLGLGYLLEIARRKFSVAPKQD